MDERTSRKHQRIYDLRIWLGSENCDFGVTRQGLISWVDVSKTQKDLDVATPYNRGGIKTNLPAKKQKQREKMNVGWATWVMG